MGNQKGSILCVEDQHEVCDLVALVLESLGYEVVKSYTYADASFKSLTSRFDLYIINSGLPDGSGAELCKAIRARDAHKPIIFTSGGDHGNELSEAKDVGVTHILSKPFSLDKLEAVVKRLLS